MNITRRQLRQIIKEELTSADAEEFESLAGKAISDALDFDIDYAYTMIDYIESHIGNKARFDQETDEVVGIAPATDRHGRPIQDVKRFKANVSNRTLRKNIRNWLGY